MPKKPSDEQSDILSPIEEAFARYRITEGQTLADAYKASHPKTHMSRDNCRKQGYQWMQRVKAKLGTWAEIYERYDAGPEGIVKVYVDGLKAMQTIIVGGKVAQIPDHRTRVYTAKELKDIHGLTDKTLNVKVDQPLPATIIVEVEKEHGTSDDSA